MTTKFLDKVIKGTGAVNGFNYTQIMQSDKAYLYKAETDGAVWYEVFNVKSVPLCIDFEKRLYSETEYKHIYPKSGDFGVWAWTCNTLERAEKKFNSINNIKIIGNGNNSGIKKEVSTFNGGTDRSEAPHRTLCL